MNRQNLFYILPFQLLDDEKNGLSIKGDERQVYAV